MIAKTFELRDAGTFIPALAIALSPGCEEDRYLIARAGFGRDPESQGKHVILTRLTGGSAEYDIYNWGGAGRTMQYAHKYIIENFDRLESGQVIDVEFILGMTDKPKSSEALSE